MMMITVIKAPILSTLHLFQDDEAFRLTAYCSPNSAHTHSGRFGLGRGRPLCGALTELQRSGD